MPILEVCNLSVAFTQYVKGLRQKEIKVISGLNVNVHSGEVLAVVGSSGSGKSLLAHAILGILPGNATVTGTIRYEGEELTPQRQAQLRGRDIALVPQSVNYLDPLMRVGEQVCTSVKSGVPADVQRAVFTRYGLAAQVEQLYPFQISGGMARRVLVSTAIVSGAQLVIADEPTPGLDAAALNETLGFFREMADEGRAVMMITHDIDSARKIADKIAVFYAGTTVEVALAKDFCGEGEALRHPYSKALWKALPNNGFQPIGGFQPFPHNMQRGCLFAPRCQMSTPECKEIQPEVRTVRCGMVRCIHAS